MCLFVCERYQSQSLTHPIQLVTGRLGKMMRSTDKNAELRYLVEVDEDWQKRVLGMAFDGKFDKVADLDDDNGRCEQWRALSAIS